MNILCKVFCLGLILFSVVSAQSTAESVVDPNDVMTPGINDTITTSAKPKTTTETTTTSTTTTATTTTTTTTPPSTTTTAAPMPTTTAKPGPVPQPTAGTWIYHDAKSNATCILLQMALQLNVTYIGSENKTQSGLFNLPDEKLTHVNSGSCSNDTQEIELSWGVAEAKNAVLMRFSSNTTLGEFKLSEIVFNFNVSANIPNAAANQSQTLYHVADEFITPLKRSYYCTKVQNFNLTNSEASNVTIAKVELSQLHIEAFHTKDNNQYSEVKDCESPGTPDIVPIAVGCALAALVVVVLIAYLVGRRNAHARGYLSM